MQYLRAVVTRALAIQVTYTQHSASISLLVARSHKRLFVTNKHTARPYVATEPFIAVTAQFNLSRAGIHTGPWWDPGKRADRLSLVIKGVLRESSVALPLTGLRRKRPKIFLISISIMIEGSI